jgi:hypothetical protein
MVNILLSTDGDDDDDEWSCGTDDATCKISNLSKENKKKKIRVCVSGLRTALKPTVCPLMLPLSFVDRSKSWQERDE